MTDLLDYVVQAHCGLERWNELQIVSAHLPQGGVTWEILGQKGVLDDVYVTVSLHDERVSHYPFGAAGRSVFTPERVAIEDGERTVVESLDQPRASFAGHALGTPWTTPRLAYFAGTAMWTYLTQPFTFTLPDSKQPSWNRGRKTASAGAGCAGSGQTTSPPSAPC